MSIKRVGLLQALGVTAYCGFIGLLLGNGDNIFGNLDAPLAPVLMLMLLSTSVLICAAIVLYKPYRLFVEGKKKEALDAVISTAVWLLIFVSVLIVAIIIFK